MKDSNFFSLVARYWSLMLVIILVVFGISLFYYRSKPASVYGSVSVTVRGIPAVAASPGIVVQADSANSTTQLVSTSQSWVQDPAYVHKIVDRAALPVADMSIPGLAKVFKVTSQTANSANYRVDYVGQTMDESTRALSALQEQMLALKEQYNQQVGSGLKMDFLFSEPVYSTSSGTVPLTPLAGLGVGIILALVLAAFLDRSRN